MTSKLKLHLANSLGKPLCGRQLTALAPSQDHLIRDTSGMVLTQDLSQVECRHCLRAAGLLAPITSPAGAIDEAEGESELEESDV